MERCWAENCAVDPQRRVMGFVRASERASGWGWIVVRVRFVAWHFFLARFRATREGSRLDTEKDREKSCHRRERAGDANSRPPEQTLRSHCLWLWKHIIKTTASHALFPSQSQEQVAVRMGHGKCWSPMDLPSKWRASNKNWTCNNHFLDNTLSGHDYRSNFPNQCGVKGIIHMLSWRNHTCGVKGRSSKVDWDTRRGLCDEGKSLHTF